MSSYTINDHKNILNTLSKHNKKNLIKLLRFLTLITFPTFTSHLTNWLQHSTENNKDITFSLEYYSMLKTRMEIS